MRLKKKTYTEEYYVYDCPICGKEVKTGDSHNNETSPCYDCYHGLLTLVEYEKYKHLIGAVVSDIKVNDYALRDFTLTTIDGRKYCVYSIGDCDGGSYLDIEQL